MEYFSEVESNFGVAKILIRIFVTPKYDSTHIHSNTLLHTSAQRHHSIEYMVPFIYCINLFSSPEMYNCHDLYQDKAFPFIFSDLQLSFTQIPR